MTGWSSNDWKVGPPIPRIGSGSDWSLTALVVIPCRNGQPRLEAVLVALSKQTYPTDLFRVVVVDDGSNPPLNPSVPEGLQVGVIRSWEDSVGASAARSVGAVGDADVFVFLDADMLPESTWLEAHMRWHEHRSDAAVVGVRRHVEITTVAAESVARVQEIAELFDSVEYFQPEWLEEGWRASGDGSRNVDDVWRLVSSGNLSVAAGLYKRSGGFDPDYWNEWGGEDNELGYRLVVGGGMIIPDRSAMAWHLGLGTSHRHEATAQRERSRLRLASRVPSDLLPRSSSIVPETPEFSLKVLLADDDVHTAMSLVDGLLDEFGNRIGISLVIPIDHPDRALLELLLVHESRVQIIGDDDPVCLRWRRSRVSGWIMAATWAANGASRAMRSLKEGEIGHLSVISADQEIGAFTLTRLASGSDALMEAASSRNVVRRVSSIEEWS